MIQTRLRPLGKPSLRVTRLWPTEPILRNGHALILSTLITSGLGFVFWILAAHSYNPEVIGKNNAAIAALGFLGGVAQLNLTTVLIRFIPVAGQRRFRFIVCAYAICGVVGTLIGSIFLLAIPDLVPSLSYLDRGWLYKAWWILSTITWSIFVLEDGAMTGLRKARWVPIENAGFSVLKIGLVIPFATLFPSAGIFLAWTVGSILTIIPTNFYLFRRAVPEEQRRSPQGEMLLSQVRRYAPFDFLAQLSWLAATSLLPLLIIHKLGAKANAYFSFDWLIAYVLFLVAINLGSSLIVETANDRAQIALQARRVLSHSFKILLVAVGAIVLFAPLILDLFGVAYSHNGVTTLRILALASLPHALVAVSVCALRSQKRTKLIFVIDFAICAIVMLLSWVLIPHIGIAGAAAAWLIALSVTGMVLLGTSKRWLQCDYRLFPTVGEFLAHSSLILARWGVVRIVQTVRAFLNIRANQRYFYSTLPQLIEGLNWKDRPVVDILQGHQVRPSLSDTTVVLLPATNDNALTVVKIARTQKSMQDLERNRDAVNALLNDERLGSWRQLIPQSRFHMVDSQAFSIEPRIAGLSAENLLKQAPHQTTLILNRCREAITKLHEATSVTRIVDQHIFDLFAGRSFHAIAQSQGALDVLEKRGLQILEARLWLWLSAGQTTLARIHGDFTPGNVIFDDQKIQVTGILDWGQSVSLGIPEVDHLNFLLAAYCQRHNIQFGHLVRALLIGRMDVSNELMETIVETSAQHTSFIEVLLLTWLLHVGGNLQKSERYRNNRLWWASNVNPVLREIL